ncbi:hypothetical protein ALQ72_04490 [Pseudomonas syringae pv. maculicola]|uniref:Uncharacterized protein n=1 Tax=Pseudomonas syringae pv. maculicola TaxID=59511 RepID=A0A0N0WUC5_PSEYM|nr:Uncharacterized protein AC503_2676 [Pseudomonas syringae pv. maculicola]RMM77180.1 hypothetical protein ALQ72_04490 [Pseudomonas syringae pv. maculicola]RMV41170.1 hypothetical protein ALP13_104045 [Pseudomonas syringae pv. maculicola]
MKKIVESSFTCGNVGMDVRLIKTMILDAETKSMGSSE